METRLEIDFLFFYTSSLAPSLSGSFLSHHIDDLCMAIFRSMFCYSTLVSLMDTSCCPFVCFLVSTIERDRSKILFWRAPVFSCQIVALAPDLQGWMFGAVRPLCPSQGASAQPLLHHSCLSWGRMAGRLSPIVNVLKYRSTSEGGEGFLGGGEEARGEDPTNQVQNKATPRRGGHPTPGGEFKLENRCHLTKKYSCCSHGRGQHCLQPSIPGVDNVFDVVGADRSDHSHPHAHHDSPNHDHDEMGSVSKEKIGGEEDDREKKPTRKLWTKSFRDDWSSI